jgi:hypothetical protein
MDHTDYSLDGYNNKNHHIDPRYQQQQHRMLRAVSRDNLELDTDDKLEQLLMQDRYNNDDDKTTTG